eukprot:ctg_93.g22
MRAAAFRSRRVHARPSTAPTGYACVRVDTVCREGCLLSGANVAGAAGRARARRSAVGRGVSGGLAAMATTTTTTTTGRRQRRRGAPPANAAFSYAGGTVSAGAARARDALVAAGAGAVVDAGAGRRPVLRADGGEARADARRGSVDRADYVSAATVADPGVQSGAAGWRVGVRGASRPARPRPVVVGVGGAVSAARTRLATMPTGVVLCGPLRVAGVRLVHIGRARQYAPRYEALGALLSLQLAGDVGLYVRRHAGSWARQCRKAWQWAQHRLVPAPADKSVAGTRPVAPRESSPTSRIPCRNVNRHDEHATARTASVTPSRSPLRCVLCLEAVQAPAATACGHVFCWHCVADWVWKQRECPLCRAPAQLRELLCLYHVG